MAKPPTVTELRKLARKRGATLRGAESGLMDKAKAQERKLNRYVLNTLIPSLDISNNRVKNTNANLKKINKAGGLKKFIKNVVNLAMFEYYESEFNKISRGTNSYFNRFEPTEAQKTRIFNRGQTLVDGFVDSLFDNNQIVTNIQGTVRNAITTNQPVSELKQLLTEQIKGKDKKLGSLSSFHYQNGYNEFQAYARGLDDEFSRALDLNYAIYAGGEIKTTRDFCDERNGNVYNRETILSWNNLEWQGKKENNNILIDLGGYNCRHDLDWISYQLAKRLNPEIEKSKFDKK